MEHKIKVCMGSSCFARGNMKNLEFIESFINENNLEAKIDLVGAHCQNKCENGPHVFIDDIAYDEVDEDKLKEALNQIK